jgi:hypothetical protein
MLIGMPEAARRAGFTSTFAISKALRNAGILLHQINQRALAVDEDELSRFVEQRRDSGYKGRGRPSSRARLTSTVWASPEATPEEIQSAKEVSKEALKKALKKQGDAQ